MKNTVQGRTPRADRVPSHGLLPRLGDTLILQSRSEEVAEDDETARGESIYDDRHIRGIRGYERLHIGIRPWHGLAQRSISRFW